MTKDYPILPQHLNTTRDPKGFDTLLNYDQRIILWAFIQFCQYKNSWQPFSLREFIAFISKKDSMVNSNIKSGVMFFVGTELRAILHSMGEGDDEIYEPTHFVISTYFLWNPLWNPA